MDPVDVLDRVAVFLLALQVELPGAAEQVEIVDVIAAQRRLQGAEHVGEIDPQRLHLVAVDVEEQLRRAGRVGGEHAGQQRVLVGGEDQRPRHGGEVGGIAALQVEQLVLEAAAGAEADDRRHVERDDVGLADRRTLGPHLGDDRAHVLAGAGPLVERLEEHDEVGAVGFAEPVQRAVADHRADVGDARDVLEQLLDPLGDDGGAVDRGALGQLRLDEEGALVLRRQEAAGDDLEQPAIEQRGSRRPRPGSRTRSAPAA